MIISREYLKLAQKVAKEAIEGKDGLFEVIAILYLKAAYGYLPVCQYEEMYKAGVYIYEDCEG